MTTDTALDLLLDALGFRNDKDPKDEAKKQPLKEALKRYLTVIPNSIPAPKILWPLSGAFVAAGRPLTVTVQTNAPDVNHELLLLPIPLHAQKRS